MSQDTISDVSDTASSNLLDQQGTHLTSLLGFSLARDTRDSLFETTRGTNSSIGFDFAGVGFGEQWFRTVASTSYYHPALWDHVIGMRVMGGYSVGWGRESVPLFERFFLGGSNSIRSFKAQEVSPKDSSGTRIGGNIELLANVEYTVPLFFGIRAAAFFDAGNVWGPDITRRSEVRHLGSTLRRGARAPLGVPVRADSRGLRPEPEPEGGRAVRQLLLLRGLGVLSGPRPADIGSARGSRQGESG